MIKKLRQAIIQTLWVGYRNANKQLITIENKLCESEVRNLALDHFAIIDLPGSHTGISHLKKIFAALGFCERGSDYLACKQNDFVWLAEEDSDEMPALSVLPQVVIADFRLDEMPVEIRSIIYNHAQQSPAFPFDQSLLNLTKNPDQHPKILAAVKKYFQGRDWALPSVREYLLVKEFNELLAWVLVFGRVPNHFTLSIHLLNKFPNLDSFHTDIVEDCGLILNEEGGRVKGGEHSGIAQSSTKGWPTTIRLADGDVEMPLGFVEFVWRYPNKPNPILWKDYFTGFIAQHADHVIESLYVPAQSTTSL